MSERLRLVHHDNSFRVSGGPFSYPQEMGWHIVNENGHTRGVCCSSEVAKRWNDLELLVEFLKKIDAEYQITERVDQGYIECPDYYKEWLPLLHEILKP